MSELKRCSRGDKCIHPDGPYLPATHDYFNRTKRSRDGFYFYCRLCSREDGRKNWRKPEYQEKVKAKTHSQEYLAKSRAYQKERRTRPDVKAKKSEYNREYNQRQEVKQYRRDYDKTGKRKEYLREYGKSPKRLRYMRIVVSRRKARKQTLPNTLTVEQWTRCLEYFHYTCAVCCRQLNDLLSTHEANADHWIPIASAGCPGTIATNIVPLCGGVNGCNNIKGKQDPTEWLNARFGKRKARAILGRIEIYFAWVKEQDGA